MKKYVFLLGIVGCLWAVNITAHNRLNHSYAVASNVWEEGLGNHRAVLKINQAAEVVTLKMEWRRPDRNPGDKRFLIVNSVTGDTVSNVRKIKVDNESCQIQFGPVSQPGTYYFYYLPYQVQTASDASTSTPNHKGCTIPFLIPRSLVNDSPFGSTPSRLKQVIAEAGMRCFPHVRSVA
jgi:hypothetical protein